MFKINLKVSNSSASLKSKLPSQPSNLKMFRTMKQQWETQCLWSRRGRALNRMEMYSPQQNMQKLLPKMAMSSSYNGAKPRSKIFYRQRMRQSRILGPGLRFYTETRWSCRHEFKKRSIASVPSKKSLPSYTKHRSQVQRYPGRVMRSPSSFSRRLTANNQVSISFRFHISIAEVRGQAWARENVSHGASSYNHAT